MSVHLRISALALAALAVPTLTLAVGAGDQAPPWTARDLQGHTVKFPRDVKGVPTVLLFWATWCPYCHAFIPELKGIQKDYARYGVRVLAIDFADKGDVAAYVDKLDFPLHVIMHGDTIAKAYDVKYTPGLMVIDGGGTVVYRRRSTELPAGQTVAKMWDSQVRKALDKAIGRAH